jgi:hypothetical protein
MPSDPNTMTLDEIRDWLAERKGWKQVLTDPDGMKIIQWSKDGIVHGIFSPIPPTLDAAAAALPEGWNFNIEYKEARKDKWLCYFWRPMGAFPALTRIVADTELLARFRLAMLCILAEESTNAK